MTDSFSAESRGWGDNVWLPGPLPWRLQQTWGGGDVRCSRLCKVIYNEKKKRQTILNIDNVQTITNSKTLRLLGPGQDYSKLLGSMGGQGLYHPFMQVEIKILLEMKIHARICSCMAILCILFGLQFLT